jgi:WD40 repeat protein
VTTFFGLSDALSLITGAEANTDMAHLISTRPWAASMVAPTNVKELSAVVPLTSGLKLRHILGLQTFHTRLSVRFNNIGDVIYPASKYVCVYQKKYNAQMYYHGHSAELSCVSVSRDGLIAASAEKCHRPQIHIWDTGTCQEIVVLPVLHRKGVTCMQFSADRKLLLSVGQDDDFSIALWMSATGSWADGKIVSWTKADVNPPLFCAFYDQNQGLAGDGFLFATGGRYHQKFWKLSGKCINAHYPEYEKKVKIGTLLCGTAVGNRFVSGSTRGHLYVWNGRKLDRMIRAHELGITCIWAGDTGVVTAAKDGIVKIWTLQFEHVRSVMLSEADVPPVLGAVRSLDAFMSPDNTFISRILVTTAGTYVVLRQWGWCLLILCTHVYFSHRQRGVRGRRQVGEHHIVARGALRRRAVGPCHAPHRPRRVRHRGRRPHHPHLVGPGPQAAAQGRDRLHGAQRGLVPGRALPDRGHGRLGGRQEAAEGRSLPDPGGGELEAAV